MEDFEAEIQTHRPPCDHEGHFKTFGNQQFKEPGIQQQITGSPEENEDQWL